MEAELSVKKLKELSRQMEICRKGLKRKVQELEALRQKIIRNSETEEQHRIFAIVKEQENNLCEQEEKIAIMQTVLDKIIHYYTECEEDILDESEGVRKLFSEQLREAELENWCVVPVILKK